MSSAGNPSERLAVITTKTVKFSYSAPRELANIFEDFGRMCNDAIRLAVEKKPRNRFSLIELAYQKLKGYGLHTHSFFRRVRWHSPFTEIDEEEQLPM